jgi:chromosome segregation ATPase
MSNFDEAKAQVEGLWEQELDDLRREREEVESRASDAWIAADDHQGRAGVLARQLEECRSELAALPGKMGSAQLEDDQAEIVSLQGSHAALTATVADQTQALEETHAAIGAATLAMTAAEEAAHRLAVSENALKREIWDQFEGLDAALLNQFARSIQADRLPTFIAHEREAYVAAIRRQAQRLGKPEPGGIVIARPSPREVPEPDTVRLSQLAPRG